MTGDALQLAQAAAGSSSGRPCIGRPAAHPDAALPEQVRRVHTEDNHGTSCVWKVWLPLNREGIPVARCTVRRLMRADGLVGVRRGNTRRTTVANSGAQRPADLVQ